MPFESVVILGIGTIAICGAMLAYAGWRLAGRVEALERGCPFWSSRDERCSVD